MTLQIHQALFFTGSVPLDGCSLFGVFPSGNQEYLVLEKAAWCIYGQKSGTQIGSIVLTLNLRLTTILSVNNVTYFIGLL